MSLIDDSAATITAVAGATSQLAVTLRQSQLLHDPEGLGNHLTCREADDFADLFDALDLGDLATALRAQHWASDEDDEKENHV